LRHISVQETISPQPSTINPQPSFLHSRPSTLDPRPSTLDPQPSTLAPQPCTLHPQPSTLPLSPRQPPAVNYIEAFAKVTGLGTGVGTGAVPRPACATFRRRCHPGPSAPNAILQHTAAPQTRRFVFRMKHYWRQRAPIPGLWRDFTVSINLTRERGSKMKFPRMPWHGWMFAKSKETKVSACLDDFALVEDDDFVGVDHPPPRFALISCKARSQILERKQLSPLQLHSTPVRFVGPASGRGTSKRSLKPCSKVNRESSLR